MPKFFLGHPKSRKTRTTYSDLRLVPRNLIASFPSLNLNPANKVCSTVCCRKLYALCGSHTLDSQDSHVTLDAVHQIPEDQPAVSASVSSDDLSAPLDTDVRCEASMEVNPETNVEQMEVGLNPAHPILAQGGDEVNPGSHEIRRMLMMVMLPAVVQAVRMTLVNAGC